MFLCLGMYSSASAWTFNVVQQIAASLVPAKRVVPVFVANELPDCDEAAATLIVKNHGSPLAAELGRRAAAIIVAIRDPLDAVASLMRHNKATFELALAVTETSARACTLLGGHPKLVLLRFEDRFFDDPATVRRIAAVFPGALSESESMRIFSVLRRDAVEAFVAGLDTLASVATEFDALTGQWDTYDSRTGWHKHHTGRAGEVGRWRRELSAPQVEAIEWRLQPWMERSGYELTKFRPYTLKVRQYGIIG